MTEQHFDTDFKSPLQQLRHAFNSYVMQASWISVQHRLKAAKNIVMDTESNDRNVTAILFDIKKMMHSLIQQDPNNAAYFILFELERKGLSTQAITECNINGLGRYEEQMRQILQNMLPYLHYKNSWEDAVITSSIVAESISYMDDNRVPAAMRVLEPMLREVKCCTEDAYFQDFTQDLATTIPQVHLSVFAETVMRGQMSLRELEPLDP